MPEPLATLQTQEVVQTALPYDPFEDRGLPGIHPMRMSEWLHVDEAFAGQMALRERLLADRRSAVLALAQQATEAAGELLDLVLQAAYPGCGQTALRPDGVTVGIDRADPLGTLGRLVQEDFCILQKSGDEHLLTGAVLCFPASWTLSEKFLRPLTAIHVPVASYDDSIAKRVQRLFDGVQPGRPIWRFNALWYASAQLHHPLGENEKRKPVFGDEGLYFRSERQSILRLPRTGAVVFSIHTYLLRRQDAENLQSGGSEEP